MCPPGDDLVIAANRSLADPALRESVIKMHADGVSLTQMVEALGLDDDMSARVQEILNGLPPDVVDGIRTATLEMLERSESALPLDCEITEAQLEGGVPVQVDVSRERGHATIRVRVSS